MGKLARAPLKPVLMPYTALLPAVPLRRYIARYWMLRGTFATGESITLLPEGSAHVVFTFGEGVRSVNHGDAFGGEGPYLVGAMLHVDRQVIAGEQYLVGVTFRPGALGCFHAFDPMLRAVNRVQPFDAGIPADAICARESLAQLSPLLDRFYLERLLPTRARLTEVLEDIALRRGQVRIDDLLRRHAVTGRWLERKFAEDVGLAPKQFIDLTRFRNALSVVERDHGRYTLARIARDCGYYDGAHLSNAFKRFLGQSPSGFALSDLSKSAASVSDTVTG